MDAWSGVVVNSLCLCQEDVPVILTITEKATVVLFEDLVLLFFLPSLWVIGQGGKQFHF